MIRVELRPIIFGKMNFLLKPENEFTHEIKRDGMTSFVDSACWQFAVGGMTRGHEAMLAWSDELRPLGDGGEICK